MTYQGNSKKGGHGGGYTSKASGKKAMQPFPMQDHFIPQDRYRIHRDVLRIRIRQHLGQSALSWYGFSDDNRPGHFYRAERSFTQHEIDDLIADSDEYTRDPETFQARLDQRVWDYSQWTDQGEPGSSRENPRNRQRPMSGGETYGMNPPGRAGNTSNARGKQDVYGTYGSYQQGQAYGQDGTYTNTNQGQTQTGSYTTAPRYGTGQYPNAQYATQSGATGAYSDADTFLNDMSQGYPQGYQQQGYGANTGGTSRLSTECSQCGHSAKSCVCQVVNA